MVRARRGAIVPHAPLLAPDVAPRDGDARVGRVRAAVREVARDFGGMVVVVSPHGARSGVYLHPHGDLAGFGIGHASARAPAPEAAIADLARAWDRPVLEEPLDHGVVVPMLLAAHALPVIGVAFAEDADPADDAAALADVLRATSYDVIASVNTGAGITERAPTPPVDGAVGLEADLRDAVATDVSAVEAVVRRLATDATSCSLGPLLVMARLFAGEAGQVLAHEWPFGVGYLVARVQAAR